MNCVENCTTSFRRLSSKLVPLREKIAKLEEAKKADAQ